VVSALSFASSGRAPHEEEGEGISISNQDTEEENRKTQRVKLL
jgi:hypothetical protein